MTHTEHPSPNWEPGMSIEANLINYLKRHPKGKLLEFGSGDGTETLASIGYEVYSVEQDKEFLSPESVLACYAPIEGSWYKHSLVEEFVREHHPYSVCLVDGPCKPVKGALNYRDGILAHWRHLARIQTVIIDDTHRPEGRQLVNGMATLLERVPVMIKDGHKEFTVLSIFSH